jgi:hypothetical protein
MKGHHLESKLEDVRSELRAMVIELSDALCDERSSQRAFKPSRAIRYRMRLKREQIAEIEKKIANKRKSPLELATQSAHTLALEVANKEKTIAYYLGAIGDCSHALDLNLKHAFNPQQLSLDLETFKSAITAEQRALKNLRIKLTKAIQKKEKYEHEHEQTQSPRS